MKKLLFTTSFVLIAFVFIIIITNDSKPTYSKDILETYLKTASLESLNYIPDVMNNINILEEDNNFSNYYTVNLDSFPVFSGYPKHISGSSREGGIFCNMDSDSDLEIVYNIG